VPAVNCKHVSGRPSLLGAANAVGAVNYKCVRYCKFPLYKRCVWLGGGGLEYIMGLPLLGWPEVRDIQQYVADSVSPAPQQLLQLPVTFFSRALSLQQWRHCVVADRLSRLQHPYHRGALG